MRNFPIQANQNPVSPSDLSKPEKGTVKEAFVSSVTGKWKAYKKVDGDYVKWTTESYSTPEEALASL
jgi:hypothetical protein